MSDNVKLTTPGDMNARIAKRLRPINETSTADHHAVHGTGDKPVVTTVHHAGQNAAHGAKPRGGE